MNEVPDIQPSSPQAEGESAVVLAAVDTSPAAWRVIDLATRIVRRTWQSAELHIVHVFQVGPLEAGRPAGLPVEELVEEARQYLEYNVRKARRQCSSKVTGHFVEGAADQEIAKLARTLSADLIVVGAHEAIGPKRWLFKSVAQKLARDAPCPVLVMRDKQRPRIKVA